MSGRKYGKKKKKGNTGYWSERKKEKKPGITRGTKKKIFLGTVIVIIILVIAVPVTILKVLDEDSSSITSEGSNNNNNPTNPINPIDPDIEPSDPIPNTAPFNNAGIGSDDWWIKYPSQHPSSGSIVDHPDCAFNPLSSKPVVIFAHSEGCAPCEKQGEDMEKVLNEIGKDNVKFYDLITPNPDPDPCINKVFDAYDPNAEQSFIPLTVIVTLIKDNSGDVQIAWHSSEGATGEDWLREYIKDAIYYHDQNSAGW